MMRIAGRAYALVLCSAAVLAEPLQAADLMDRFEAIGTMTATIGDVGYDMVIAYDREKDRGYAERKIIMGRFLTINTVGQVVNDQGKPATPMLQVTLQEQDGEMRLLSAELFDEQGFDAPMVMGPDGAAGSLTDYKLEGDSLMATVTGEALRLTGYSSGSPAPAEGAVPQPVTVSWTVTLPPLED